MNKVILIGRLTRDPDARYTQGQEPMCIARYTLAVDRRVSRNNQDGQTADFIGCVAFGKSGEFIEKYCHKGTKLCVTGRIQTGSYTNKDGQKIYTTDVVAEDQEFAESKSAQGQGGFSGGYSGHSAAAPSPAPESGSSAATSNAAPSVPSSTGSSEQPSAAEGFMNIPDGIDEELPFS